jgi:hypothetical protein
LSAISKKGQMSSVTLHSMHSEPMHCTSSPGVLMNGHIPGMLAPPLTADGMALAGM